jgi:hypothetical protein
MTEAELLAEVVRLAESLGLVVLHVREPRREGGHWAGFPDLIVFGRGVFYRELKQSGKDLRAEQKRWRWLLGRAGQDHAVWTPADWHSGRIRRELEQLASQTARDGAADGHDAAAPEPDTARERFNQVLYSRRSLRAAGVP